jgi:hypothetical protein
MKGGLSLGRLPVLGSSRVGGCRGATGSRVSGDTIPMNNLTDRVDELIGRGRVDEQHPHVLLVEHIHSNDMRIDRHLSH